MLEQRGPWRFFLSLHLTGKETEPQRGKQSSQVKIAWEGTKFGTSPRNGTFHNAAESAGQSTRLHTNPRLATATWPWAVALSVGENTCPVQIRHLKGHYCLICLLPLFGIRILACSGLFLLFQSSCGSCRVWEFKSYKHLENSVALLQSLSLCSPRFPLSILPTFSSP